MYTIQEAPSAEVENRKARVNYIEYALVFISSDQITLNTSLEHSSMLQSIANELHVCSTINDEHGIYLLSANGSRSMHSAVESTHA